MERILLYIKSFWLIPLVFFAFLMLNDSYHYFVREKDIDWLQAALINLGITLAFTLVAIAIIYFASGKNNDEN